MKKVVLFQVILERDDKNMVTAEKNVLKFIFHNKN